MDLKIGSFNIILTLFLQVLNEGDGFMQFFLFSEFGPWGIPFLGVRAPVVWLLAFF